MSPGGGSKREGTVEVRHVHAHVGNVAEEDGGGVRRGGEGLDEQGGLVVKAVAAASALET
jgi:hypothetical protein